MSYKPNFIKRDRMDTNKIPTIKDTYDRMSKEKRNLRKDEPFVLMFRDFVFFDVKSYECRNGDLYIRNLVDGIILKRYFRLGSDDQLTVFKNRNEFDEFVDKVKNNGYLFGPIHKKSPLADPTIDTAIATNLSQESLEKIDKVLSNYSHDEYIKRVTSQASDQFILESYIPVRDPNTGDIVSIKSTWDGASFTYEDSPSFFDKIARVFENRSINEVLERKGGTY